MNSRRKRLMKLMQSVGIQRNDFAKTLENIRNYDKWTYQDIVNWIDFKRELGKSENQLPMYITSSDKYWNGYLINLALTLGKVGIDLLNTDKTIKRDYEILEEIALIWNDLA